MSALHAEVYEAFRALDVPDDKALRAAVALSTALTAFEDDTKRGFDRRDADIEAIRKDIASIKGEIGAINTRLAVFQGEVDKRFVESQGAFDKRFASFQSEIDKRFASFQGEIDKRFASFQGEVSARFATMQGEINLLKWMMATSIALLVTVLFRVFTH